MALALFTYLVGVLGGIDIGVFIAAMVRRTVELNPPDCVAARHGLGSTPTLCPHPHHSIGRRARVSSQWIALPDSAQLGMWLVAGVGLRTSGDCRPTVGAVRQN